MLVDFTLSNARLKATGRQIMDTGRLVHPELAALHKKLGKE